VNGALENGTPVNQQKLQMVSQMFYQQGYKQLLIRYGEQIPTAAMM
jgi:hypothetical protein